MDSPDGGWYCRTQWRREYREVARQQSEQVSGLPLQACRWVPR
jgi:hypothetical protein